MAQVLQTTFPWAISLNTILVFWFKCQLNFFQSLFQTHWRYCSIAPDPPFVQVMAWCRTGDKPLPGAMMTQFTEARMRRPPALCCSHVLWFNHEILFWYILIWFWYKYIYSLCINQCFIPIRQIGYCRKGPTSRMILSSTWITFRESSSFTSCFPTNRL